MKIRLLFRLPAWFFLMCPLCFRKGFLGRIRLIREVLRSVNDYRASFNLRGTGVRSSHTKIPEISADLVSVCHGSSGPGRRGDMRWPSDMQWEFKLSPFACSPLPWNFQRYPWWLVYAI
ncbi:uncharacterized protein BDCG_03255 [Blastomyces dermatitidis ER-3]|uniref:Secreted protein n=1 Tax=Ajellomyces dermatitidis (strain ER-3 / ATCC MYA-2586) TaxID=559297 RepID=A0ABP2EVW0_AJEDR|nr:uncharacterized protein BDCG_03255 [Blastomyces dermatitidis ER-3]EEQ88135.2 hypothetical protein BDCG_03255 [Blastomyces dermatitidis ER-3]